MRRTLTMTIATLLGMVLIGHGGCQGCKDEPVDDDSAAADDDDTSEGETYRGMWADMEITSSGEVLVAYYDYLEGGLGLARSSDPPGSWSHEQIDGFTYTTEGGLPVNPGDRGRYLSMALDASDTPHIAYHDRDETSLMYTTFDGESWTNLTIDGNVGSAQVGLFNSLALDAAGNPGIAYYDEKNKALKFAYYSGGWSIETVDEGELLQDAVDAEIDETDVGRYADLVVADGTWWIAYYDAANGNLKMAHGTPGSWTIETLAGDQDGDRGAWPCLYSRGSGEFLIAYQDVGEQDLRVARYAGGTLTSDTLVDDGEFVGADSVIAEIGGAVRIHYFDGVNNDVKQAIDHGDGTWSVSTLVSDGAVGYSNNLAPFDGKMAVCSFNYTTGSFQMDLLDP